MNTIKIDSGRARMIAHRGLSGIERENTYPAFVAAGNRSYYGIETDIHKTADGKFVVIHDKTTDRVSLGEVKVDVEESTCAQLRNIVLPDVDGSKNRQDIRIPFLEDYLKICKKYDKICILELKGAFETEDIRRIIEEIETAHYLESMIFISFSLQNCISLRNILPDASIQWLTEEISEDIIKTLLKYNFDVDVYYKALTKENVDSLHMLGIKVNCWTCDSKEDAEKLVEMGVDFITTNILE